MIQKLLSYVWDRSYVTCQGWICFPYHTFLRRKQTDCWQIFNMYWKNYLIQISTIQSINQALICPFFKTNIFQVLKRHVVTMSLTYAELMNKTEVTTFGGDKLDVKQEDGKRKGNGEFGLYPRAIWNRVGCTASWLCLIWLCPGRVALYSCRHVGYKCNCYSVHS